MTNAQNDKPSDGQSAAFGLAPCSALYRHTAKPCRIALAPPEDAPWTLRATFEDGITSFSFHPSRLHDWFEVIPDARAIALQAGVACPQKPTVRCIWPDCLAIGCPIAKPNA